MNTIEKILKKKACRSIFLLWYCQFGIQFLLAPNVRLFVCNETSSPKQRVNGFIFVKRITTLPREVIYIRPIISLVKKRSIIANKDP